MFSSLRPLRGLCVPPVFCLKVINIATLSWCLLLLLRFRPACTGSVSSLSIYLCTRSPLSLRPSPISFFFVNSLHICTSSYLLFMMDFISKPVFPELSDVVHCAAAGLVGQENLLNANVVDDGISSLLKMAESMEALLPPDISSDIFSPDNSNTRQTSTDFLAHSAAQTSLSHIPTNENNRNSTSSGNELTTEPVPASQFLSEHFPLSTQANDGLQILSLLSRETSCEEISNDISYATPDMPSSPTEVQPFLANASFSSATNSSHSHIPIDLTALINHGGIFNPTGSDNVPSQTLNETPQSLESQPFGNFTHLLRSNVCDDVFTPVSGASPVHNSQVALDIPSGSWKDCAGDDQEIQCFSCFDHDNTFQMRKHKSTEDLSRISKSRKTARKPKTYSKPVASRFCHICSRMPRRGQGSAVCKRISEGLCRKIVCEQCIREQGWDYESIKNDKNGWLCPHCADICPSRSQCHIYNRINARRKRTSSTRTVTAENCSVNKSGLHEKSPLSSGNNLRYSLSSKTGHFVESLQPQGVQQILQPPPNFRLNLPLPYPQM